MNQSTITPNSELFATFYKGFSHFLSLTETSDSVVFKTVSHPGNSCDNARKRINELNLPLIARIESHNSFSIQTKN